MVTPNQLTISRFILSFFSLTLLLLSSPAYSQLAIISFIIFSAAIITDFLDGYIARKYGLITDFGKIADPIADKFLILGIFIIFSIKGLCPFILTFIILIREISVTALRLAALKDGYVIAAEKSGKYKVLAQTASIIFLWLVYYSNLTCRLLSDMEIFLLFAFLAITIVLTLYSGMEFFIKNHELLIKKRWHYFTGTFFYTGNISKKIPGTIGSLFATLFFIVFHNLLFKNIVAYTTIIVLFFIIGIWASKRISLETGSDDPSFIVIDEAVGIFISFFLLTYNAKNILLSLILFRFFDIIKPWPIKKVEKLPFGWGIMLDDVVAGIFANLVMRYFFS